MVDVDGAEFVSIDPFDSVLKNHNTTLDYGLLGLIKLINLQHACSKESLGISFTNLFVSTVIIVSLQTFSTSKLLHRFM